MSRMQSGPKDLADLEAAIDYVFKNRPLLEQAMTHASATSRSSSGKDYERLEFVGDRVLGLCVSELLYKSFPQALEGELSVRLNALVSGNTCAEIADELRIHQYIRAGSDVQNLGGKRMKSVRADVMESLIAAIHLDGGIDAARTFVGKFWTSRLKLASAGNRDSKTALQEWAHANSYTTPVYEVIDQSGPDHDPRFRIRVDVGGIDGEEGEGRSKRIAEQRAAETLLLREGVWQHDAEGNIVEKDGY